jgi:hypothetical protein
MGRTVSGLVQVLALVQALALWCWLGLVWAQALQLHRRAAWSSKH